MLTRRVNALDITSCPRHQREIVLTMCAGYHGSTALESILMSSAQLGTLCSADVWQCEGDHVLCNCGCDCTKYTRATDCQHGWAANACLKDETKRDPGWNYSTALHVWSRHWPLHRHVMLEKTPNIWRRVQSMVHGLQTAPIPPIMASRGIQRLVPKVLLMWRPWCLAGLSSHARAEQRANYSRWVRKELVFYNGVFVARHRALTEARVPVLCVSYADLLFRSRLTLARIERFLPCLGRLDASFVPVMGRDIFPGNEWKVRGSVAQYSAQPAAVAARSSMSSDGLSCRDPGGSRDILSSLTPEEQQAARASERYLEECSRTE